MQSDTKEILIRILKYLVQGIGVSVATHYISNKKINISEIIGIGITAASIFSILDLVSPAISAGIQLPTGIDIGQNLGSVQQPIV